MLEATNLTKEYPTPRGPIPILSGVSLSLQRGDAVSIMGPSGSGKSTLLYIWARSSRPPRETVTLDGTQSVSLKERDLAAFRNKEVGFIFQDHCLLPQCSVLENVLTPTLVAAKQHGKYEETARSLLADVGLGARLDHRPAELSGGEKQRAALARAMILDPLVMLCDEPTGNLDHASAEVVSALLLEMNRRRKSILVVVTHSAELAARFPIRFELMDRKLCPKTK